MKNFTIGAVIIILIVAGASYFWAPQSLRFWEKKADLNAYTDDTVSPSTHERITAKHQFKNGTHIVAGETTSPTPCDILEATARIAESYPEQVTIDFTSKTSGEMCAQVVTTNRFKVDFKASENATIKATWNGQPVEINLIPAGPNEDLLNFELFIKG